MTLLVHSNRAEMNIHKLGHAMYRLGQMNEVSETERNKRKKDKNIYIVCKNIQLKCYSLASLVALLARANLLVIGENEMYSGIVRVYYGLVYY